MAALMTGAFAAIVTHDRRGGLFFGLVAAAISSAVTLWNFKKNAHIKAELRSRYKADYGSQAIRFLDDK